MTDEFKVLHQNSKSIIRISYDAREAWFELQHIRLDPDNSESKLKILRFDWVVAQTIKDFIGATKKDFTKKTDNFDNFLSKEETK